MDDMMEKGYWETAHHVYPLGTQSTEAMCVVCGPMCWFNTYNILGYAQRFSWIELIALFFVAVMLNPQKAT